MKQLRKQLTAWGTFWREREQPKGFSSTSPTASVIEQAKTGIWATTNQYNGHSLSSRLQTPLWVQLIDEMTEQLSQEQCRVLNKRYIKGGVLTNSEKLVLLYAEISLQEKIFLALN
ncbi:hypothetical protein ACFO3I_11965 [Rheinheimera marina]|uniref:Uncharacterized protein n=1 Tax=Rheinheimera marina TaxID=1774958 RepID=A0ABV9JNI6_9GAMM